MMAISIIPNIKNTLLSWDTVELLLPTQTFVFIHISYPLRIQLPMIQGSIYSFNIISYVNIFSILPLLSQYVKDLKSNGSGSSVLHGFKRPDQTFSKG